MKTGVMKLPNLRDMSLSFPLKIPIRYKYVYTPPKYVERVKAHDFLSFDNLTGNGLNTNYYRDSFVSRTSRLVEECRINQCSS